MEPYFDHEKSRSTGSGAASTAKSGSFWTRCLAAMQNPATTSGARRCRSCNIAEGSGKWRIRDKANYYHIARASATECAASLDELVDFELVAPEHIQVPKQVLARLVAMLIGMIRSLEQRPGPDMGSRRRERP